MFHRDVQYFDFCLESYIFREKCSGVVISVLVLTISFKCHILAILLNLECALIQRYILLYKITPLPVTFSRLMLSPNACFFGYALRDLKSDTVSLRFSGVL